VPVNCEEVRELLPEYAEWGPRAAGAVEVHLASCAECSAELSSYRTMLSSLAELRELDEDAPAGYLERTLALVPGRSERMRPEWREVPERVIAVAKRRPAAASLTGAAIGVAAVGLIAWRRGRRAIRQATRLPELAPQQ
jgi:anti-sigma factor RsiW